MNKVEFEKVFAETAEKSGVAKMARDYQFAENLEAMMCELRDKLNSLPAVEEQPSEDLEKAAKEYVKENCILPEDCNDGDIPYYEECTAAVFKDGANWHKKQLINKACEWLKENIYNRVYKCNDGLGFPTAAFLAEFKKAMEE